MDHIYDCEIARKLRIKQRVRGFVSVGFDRLSQLITPPSVFLYTRGRTRCQSSDFVKKSPSLGKGGNKGGLEKGKQNRIQVGEPVEPLRERVSKKK